MTNSSLFMNAEEVAEVLRISKPNAYKKIKEINSEMERKGLFTVAGKVNKQYFCEKFYIDLSLLMGGATA